MIDGKSVFAVIPARGGSKGLFGKNIAQVGGKPMIAWSIKAAQESKYIDRTVLSSDDENIIAVTKDYGGDAPFIRPAELATDTSNTVDTLIHALDQMTKIYDYLVLLQPTSPLRITEDIDGAIKKCHYNGAPACVSGCEPAKSPYWMYHLDKSQKMRAVIESEHITKQRQDLPEVFAPNGAVFVAQVSWFRESLTFYGPDTIAYIMPVERSVDVDTVFDLTLVQALLN
jgi:CMP-N,N'-diacetyllegionaminic acid synthase